MSVTRPESAVQHVVWPWITLTAALLWAALIRVPLIVNARVHLDSDLAVDGLTLREALQGHWRWHYPGTPYMGTLPVVLSWPQSALCGGAVPETLVSGGTVAWLALTLVVFTLAWRAFGPGVAAFALVPLAFSSTGALWLSGRITGGHILTAAWHAGAFVLLHRALSRGGVGAALALGLWCGLGLWLDSMFLVTLVGLVPAGLGAVMMSGAWRRMGLPALAFVVGAAIGVVPREVGRWAEPYDAYPAQFSLVRVRSVLADHAGLLARECLPRLVAGHRFPGYASDPDPRTLGGGAPIASAGTADPIAVATTWAALVLFGVSYVALAWSAVRPRDAAQGAVSAGLLIASLVVVAGFVANTNIFNADNYRYLVTLLVPHAVGFGIALRALSIRGRGGRTAAVLIVLAVAALMTSDTARWYARLGWIDARGRPIQARLDYPALAWLDEHPEVRQIYGGYWDVYRLAFLSRGRVRGKPFTVFPDRFPEWTPGGPGNHPEVTIISPGPASANSLREAQREGAQVLMRGRGTVILHWPVTGEHRPPPQTPARPES